MATLLLLLLLLLLLVVLMLNCEEEALTNRLGAHVGKTRGHAAAAAVELRRGG
jgi:hypothetical protein